MGTNPFPALCHECGGEPVCSCKKDTEPKFTPGSHKAERIGDEVHINAEESPAGKWSAVCVLSPNELGSRRVTIEECEATGRLYSAAPDLLAACKLLLSLYTEIAEDEYGGTSLFQNLLLKADPARAAIAKAKGRAER